MSYNFAQKIDSDLDEDLRRVQENDEALTSFSLAKNPNIVTDPAAVRNTFVATLDTLDTLVAALKVNTYLKALSLDRINFLFPFLRNTVMDESVAFANVLGVAGAFAERLAEALAEVLKVNTSLTSLSLVENHIRDVGAMVLAEALKVNTSLTELDLKLNGIDNSILEKINIYLIRNRGLKAFEEMVSPTSESELRQSATEHLSDAINELKDLADTHPEAREALALFVIKFSDNGMIDNALELFARFCIDACYDIDWHSIDNEPAADALFYALLATGEGQSIFSDGFPQEVRYQLILRLGKKFLTEPENEKTLRRVLFGLKTGKQAIGEPPSFAELTGVDNPTISLDKLRELARQLSVALSRKGVNLYEENFTELVNIQTYLDNGEVKALSEEMRSVIANVKEKITLDDELLQLYHNPRFFIPYEELVFKAASKTTDDQASVAPPHKRTLTELLEQAITNLTPIEMPQAESLSLELPATSPTVTTKGTTQGEENSAAPQQEPGTQALFGAHHPERMKAARTSSTDDLQPSQSRIEETEDGMTP